MVMRITVVFIILAGAMTTGRLASAEVESLSYRGALGPAIKERIEWGRDPFAPITARAAGVVPAMPSLGAIFYNPARPSAIINGRIVYRGSVIDGQKVVDIGKSHVILQIDDRQTRLEFAQGPDSGGMRDGRNERR